MSEKIHFTKTELKTPDHFLQILNKISEWFLAHTKGVVGVVGFALLVGGAIAVYGSVKSQTEEKLQAKYYLAEKKYLDAKKKFDDSAAKANEKAKKSDAATLVPSGDPEKDYTESVIEFKGLVDASPSSKAGIMSAMILADIYRQAQKTDQALSFVEKVTGGNKPSDLLSALAFKLKGNLQADLGKCEEAIGSWKKIVDSKSFDFMSQDLKIKMGLCYEKTNDLASAEKMYQEASPSAAGASSNPSVSKEAEKYLRLLKSKKDSSGT